MKTDRLATRIAGRIICTQHRAANYLNRKTQHWNRASKLVALVLFALLFGSISIYFIFKSI